MADLYGTYDKRIKFTIDNTKIDATLTWIPITVLLTATAGEEVFAEFDADADFDKVAFTKADGTTQLYADCELFDDSAQKAIYHVSLTGWEIASGADTDFYMYYDDDASGNSTYIGLPGGGSRYPPAQSDTYVKSTTKFSTDYFAYYATDPTKLLTGNPASNSWLSSGGSDTNQRFHIDLGSAKTIKKIYYENYHSVGSGTNVGVQNFTFWGSNTGAGTFDDLVYANDEGWTQLTISQSTFDEHTASDVADPKYITVTNTIAYRYYAFKFADNYGYTNMGVRRIELQTSVAAKNVYDGDFKAVYHKNDDTTSTILDSTSNANHGTKKAANEPIEATGKVGQGQDFDGTDDYIKSGTDSSLDVTTNLTISACVSSDTAQLSLIAGKLDVGDPGYDQWNYAFRLGADNKAIFIVGNTTANTWDYALSTNALIAQDGWYHIAVTWDGTTARFYVNGTESSNHALSFTAMASSGEFLMGLEDITPQWEYEGDIDEVHFSNSVARSAAWIKAEYNSAFDTLLTYGSEETSAVEDNAIFFGTNF